MPQIILSLRLIGLLKNRPNNDMIKQIARIAEANDIDIDFR